MKYVLMAVVFMMGFTGGEVGVVISGENSAAMQQMATILHRLKHYPSPQGKAELQQILNNTSTGNNERKLATAIMNLQHSAMVADVPKLKSVSTDNGASDNERAMASIILDLDHRPSDSDKDKLAKMMK